MRNVLVNYCSIKKLKMNLNECKNGFYVNSFLKRLCWFIIVLPVQRVWENLSMYSCLMHVRSLWIGTKLCTNSCYFFVITASQNMNVHMFINEYAFMFYLFYYMTEWTAWLDWNCETNEHIISSFFLYCSRELPL